MIGALAAGVALVVQTAGVIRSNRAAIIDWIQDAVAADLIVTSGSPVAASGTTSPMSPELLERIRKLAGRRGRDGGPHPQGDVPETQVLMLAAELGGRRGRRRSLRKRQGALYEKLDQTPDGALISENFAALHRVGVGDVIPVASPGARWLHGSRDHPRYRLESRHHVRQAAATTSKAGATAMPTSPHLRRARHDSRGGSRNAEEDFGGEYGLFALTQQDLEAHIDALSAASTASRMPARDRDVRGRARRGDVAAHLGAVAPPRDRPVAGGRGDARAGDALDLGGGGADGTHRHAIGVIVGVPLEWYILKWCCSKRRGCRSPVHLPWIEALGVASGALGDGACRRMRAGAACGAGADTGGDRVRIGARQRSVAMTGDRGPPIKAK